MRLRFHHLLSHSSDFRNRSVVDSQRRIVQQVVRGSLVLPLLLLTLFTLPLHAQEGKVDPRQASESTGTVSIGMQYMMGEGMTPPSVKPSSPSIEYPELALIQGLDGMVDVKLMVDERGVVKDVNIVSSTDDLFRDAVKSVISDFDFTPATEGGKAIPMGVRMEISFKTQDSWMAAYQDGNKEEGEKEGWAYVADANLPQVNAEVLQQNLTYPEDALARGAYGVVTVRALISEKGEVTTMEVEGTADAALAEAALKAVGETPFTPGNESGTPRPMWTMVPIRFSTAGGKGRIELQAKAPTPEEERETGIIKPEYSQGELEKNLEFNGTLSEPVELTMRVLIDETGVVQQVLVSNETDAILSKAAVAAVKKTKFTPGKQNGEAIPVWVSVSMRVKPKGMR